MTPVGGWPTRLETYPLHTDKLRLPRKDDDVGLATLWFDSQIFGGYLAIYEFIASTRALRLSARSTNWDSMLAKTVPVSVYFLISSAREENGCEPLMLIDAKNRFFASIFLLTIQKNLTFACDVSENVRRAFARYFYPEYSSRVLEYSSLEYSSDRLQLQQIGITTEPKDAPKDKRN